MTVINNRLEEFPVSILTFIWQERIYCSDYYMFECNPDGVQLFTWVRSYREGTVHEEGLGIGQSFQIVW
jgi:hypothetical protein